MSGYDRNLAYAAKHALQEARSKRFSNFIDFSQVLNLYSEI